MKECEPQYKIVFHPEKRGPVPDLEHEAFFVKCLMNSFKEGSLTKTELDRRIRRGTPITVSTKPMIEKKKKKRVPFNIDAIIANVVNLTTVKPDEANQFPYIIKEAASARTEKAEESSVQNEEDGEESSVQAWEAEYAQAVCNDVFRSMA